MFSKRRSFTDDASISRLSSEQRAKEILEKYKTPTQSLSLPGDEGLPMNSLRSQYAKLMESDTLEEMNSPIPDNQISRSARKDSSSSLSSDNLYGNRTYDRRFDESNDSSNDSLDISETDLQVGTIASRLAAEKTNVRRSRVSPDGSYITEDRKVVPQVTLSPQPIHRRNDNFPVPFTGQSTISSILDSGRDNLRSGPNDMVRFGSIGQSDGDLLRTLSRASANTPDNLYQRRSLITRDSYDSSPGVSPVKPLGNSPIPQFQDNKIVNPIGSTQEIDRNRKIAESFKTVDSRKEDDDDDDVYSFNDFDDDHDEQDDKSKVIASAQQTPSESIEHHESKIQETIESREEKERRKSIDAIMARWSSNTFQPSIKNDIDIVESTGVNIKGVTIGAESTGKNTPYSDILKDDGSAVFSHRSGGRTEDPTPLNDFDNSLGGVNELPDAGSMTFSPVPVMREMDLNDDEDKNDQRNNNDVESELSILPDSLQNTVTLLNADQYYDEREKNAEEPACKDRFEEIGHRGEMTSQNESNLVMKSDESAQGLNRASKRYTDVEEDDVSEIMHNHRTSNEDRRNEDDIDQLSTDKLDIAKSTSDIYDTHPTFLKPTPNPSVVTIQHQQSDYFTVPVNKNIDDQGKDASTPRKLSANTVARIDAITRTNLTPFPPSDSLSARSISARKAIRLIPDTSRLLLPRRQQYLPAKRDVSPTLPRDSVRSSNIIDLRDVEALHKIPVKAGSNIQARRNASKFANENNSDTRNFQEKNLSKSVKSKARRPLSSATKKKVESNKDLDFRDKELKEKEMNILKTQRELDDYRIELETWEDELNRRESDATMRIQQQESFEEEVLLKQHITTLEDEIHDLKAKLFELTSERDNLRDRLESCNPEQQNGDTQPIVQAQSKVKHITVTILKGPKRSSFQLGNDEPIKINEDQIILSKAEFDEIVNERNAVEDLLTGYQRENERLGQLLRKKDLEEKQLKAQYFDQQESMNKELNRLRNLTKGIAEKSTFVDSNNSFHSKDDIHSHGTMLARKSSSQFRNELSAEAHIRYLEENLRGLQMSSSKREKELNDNIEKIRRDYRQLADRAAEESANLWEDFHSQNSKLQHQNDRLSEEMEDLKKQVAWYKENQRIIDDVYREKKDMQKEIIQLKNEIRTRSGAKDTFTKPTVNMSTDKGRKISPDIKSKKLKSALDLSNISDSHLGVSASNHGSRHAADVRRIRDLEETVRDLHESLQKRFPDSVSSLIRAASYNESSQLQITKQYQSEISKLKVELKEANEEYQRNLRSLRQEYEIMKGKYEATVVPSDAIKSPTTSLVPESDNHMDIPPLKTKYHRGVVTISQALTKIKELETENERVRKFYIKKVSDTEKKYTEEIKVLRDQNEDLIRDLSEEKKRHDVASVDSKTNYSMRTESDFINPANVHAEASNFKKFTQINYSSSQEQIPSMRNQSIRRFEMEEIFLERIERVERDLLNIKKSSSMTSSKTAIEPQSGISENSKQYSQKDLIDRTTQTDFEPFHQSKSDAQSSFEQKYADLVEEKLTLRQKLSESESLISNLSSDLRHVKAQLELLMNSPMQQHLQLMSNQIMQLEQRLAQREKDLNNSLDQCRLAGKLELARLQGIHDQEMREKEEELLKFQTKLEHLVNALRQIQNSQRPDVLE